MADNLGPMAWLFLPENEQVQYLQKIALQKIHPAPNYNEIYLYNIINMLLSRQILPENLRQEYKESCYDIIGCIHYVHKTLGPAMVEYVYQEALYKTLLKKGYNVVKEYNHHPVFDGQPLKSSIQMDMVVFRPEGNVIIECKSIADIGDREQMQTFGYMCGTQFPYAIIANFGTYPKAQVERYHFENNSINAF